MIKAILTAAMLFTTFFSVIMGIVWLTNRASDLVEPWITPILEDIVKEDE